MRLRLLVLNFYFLGKTPKIHGLNYNYNHYNWSFANIMILVIISDEDTLKLQRDTGKIFHCFRNSNLIWKAGERERERERVGSTKLLEIHINNYDDHANQLCKKVNKKLHNEIQNFNILRLRNVGPYWTGSGKLFWK